MPVHTDTYDRRNARAEQPAIPIFIPTVFVGLGGSGKSVLMRLRKQFHDRFANWGTKFDRFARFVFIDTDRGEFAPRSEKNKMFADVMPRESEVVESTIRRARFSEIFERLEMNVQSEHLHWLKPSMRAVGAGAVEDGAGTNRQFGRLAFFENYAAIRQQIKTQIEEVLAYANQHALEVAPDRIEVVLVTSLAGGTGSGMFLDVAYLVRDLLSHPDYDALRIKHVTLVAFLPEMFRSNGEALLPRLRQNAYAALLELEYYGTPRTNDALFLGEEARIGRDSRHGFRAIWPGRGEVFFAERGWDTLFLVDNVNNLARADPLSANEVFQMTADYLFLDFGQSVFATEKRTARSNLVQYKDRWKGTWVTRVPDSAVPGIRNGAENVFASQNGCIYSSFGLAEIFFDIDNLYQVSGYRLAWQLLRLRWIGSTTNHSRETYEQWAIADLINPQPLKDQPGPPPSFHPDAIARKAVVAPDGSQDWLALLEADLESLDSLDEEEAAAKLGSIVDLHRGFLVPRGEARKTIDQNVAIWSGTETVLGPWRERLNYLADKRLSEWGIEATKALLDEYRSILVEARDRCLEAEPANLGKSLLSRMEEARLVPFPVRQIAVGIELRKARGESGVELRKHYAKVGKTDAVPALISAIRYLGEPSKVVTQISDNAHGTLQELLDDASHPLDSIAKRLYDRFQVASKGRDLVNHRKQSLTVLWDEERYDRKINQAMLLFEKVRRDPVKPEGANSKEAAAKFEFTFDWVKFEKLVLAELNRVGKDGAPGSLADLLRFWKKNRMVNQDQFEKIAQRLAEACEAVIRAAGLKLADVEHGNVADLLSNAKTKEQRDRMIEQLVIAAAPYLPTRNLDPDGIQPANHNLFGLSVGDQATSAANVATITEEVAVTAAARQPGGVANFGQRLEAEQSSALFVRMMAGFPLQEYTRLEELYNAYKDPATNPRSNDECHIDFKQSWEDLPDIRAVGVETYAEVRENVDIVLLNMMIGVISYPKDRAAFYVLIPDPYGAGEDYHRLGKRISRAIKHACDDVRIRDYLADRWSRWSEGASVKAWACLYESALRTLNESRREITVEAGRVESVPFRNCYGGLLRMIGKKLSEVAGGQAWLEALKPRRNDDGGEGNGVGDGRPRPAGLDGAMRPINESLKIYQLVASKVETVSLP